MTIANTLDALLPKILARGMKPLRETVNLVQLVNSDLTAEAAKFSATIDVPYGVAMSTSSVTPAASAPEPSNITPPTVPVSLDNWEFASFGMTDQELNKIDANQSFIPLQMAEAFRAMGNKINHTVYAKYKSIYGYIGTAGTTPFGSGVAEASAINARALLTSQLAPKTDRYGILDADADAAALGLASFSDAEKRGQSQTKTTGDLGVVYGIDWKGDDYVPTHTAGTITTGLIVKASTVHAIGIKSIVCTTAAATGACALLEGDIMSFAGDSQTYTLTADATQASASTDVTITINPGLKVATAGSEAVTVKATHVVNVAFQRDCFALAMRAPNMGLEKIEGAQALTGYSSVLQDPVTGLVMRLQVIKMFMQVAWFLDAMWGTNVVRPECGVRIAG